jgi:hypothetical protein
MILPTFSNSQSQALDFSKARAADIFNNQIASTFNRVESKLNLATEEADLDEENTLAAERRQALQDETTETLGRMEAEDDAFLANSAGQASALFGSDEQAMGFSLPKSRSQNGATGADRVDPKKLQSYIGKHVAESRLNGFVPKDGARYGITKGTPEEWSRFFTGLAKMESSFGKSTVGDVGKFKGNSNGLFQLSPRDALNHKLKNTEFSKAELQDPETNTKAAIAIATNLMLQDGVIASGKKGAARYWGPLRRGKNPSKVKF